MTIAAPIATPLVSKRTLAWFAAIAALWTVLAWFIVERQLRDRTAELVATQMSEARQSLSIINTNIDQALNRLQGFAAVLAAGGDAKVVASAFGPGIAPSPLSYEARKALWTQRPDLFALSRQWLTAADEIGVDVIWLMNAGGDCVVASNAAKPTSFVGTNYADRKYFTAAQAGKPGRQYAMGRVTHVPGLFLAAPVMADGRFLGAVAVKTDLPRLAAAINDPHAFITDDQGVIILAADHSLEMLVLPGAAVREMPADQRLSRYGRTAFETLRIGAGSGPDGLMRVPGSPHPHISMRSELPQHGVTVHILVPLQLIAALRGDAFVTFLLLACFGILLVALIFGGRIYVIRARQFRAASVATNDLLRTHNKHLDILATIDPLTGLYNQRYLWDFLNREVLRAGRAGKNVAVIMLDIDHFKHFNDAWGHQAGDAVLKNVADSIRGGVRGSDIASRYGGEEILVVLPEATLPVAIERAETIRRALGAMQLHHAGRPLGAVTASLGVAVFPDHAENAEALVRAADEAMYEAKKSGRNRTVTAQSAPAFVERV